MVDPLHTSVDFADVHAEELENGKVDVAALARDVDSFVANFIQHASNSRPLVFLKTIATKIDC